MAEERKPKLKGLFGFEFDKPNDFTLQGENLDVVNRAKVYCELEDGSKFEWTEVTMQPHPNGKKLKITGTPPKPRSPKGTDDVAGDMTVTLYFGPGSIQSVSMPFSNVAFE